MFVTLLTSHLLMSALKLTRFANRNDIFVTLLISQSSMGPKITKACFRLRNHSSNAPRIRASVMETKLGISIAAIEAFRWCVLDMIVLGSVNWFVRQCLARHVFKRKRGWDTRETRKQKHNATQTAPEGLTVARAGATRCRIDCVPTSLSLKNCRLSPTLLSHQQRRHRVYLCGAVRP